MSSITPFVKRMRTTGGTMFTFSSATEDIGLNINERNNVVKISNYALLNIPSIEAPSNLQENKFDVLAIQGALKSFLNPGGQIKDGRVLISESFQNYALNLEANLLNQPTYNPQLLTSVAERVFWKWLKETGAIRWQDSSEGYFEESSYVDSSIAYNPVVKCVGQISAGSMRTDNFGTYNETYVLVPTSYGQTRVFFKQIEDENYMHGMAITNGNVNILGRETYTKPHPDGLDFKAYYDIDIDSSITTGSVNSYNMYYDYSTGYTRGWWTTAEGISFAPQSYYTDISTYLTTGNYNVNLRYSGISTVTYTRSLVDCLSIEFDINNLQNLYSDPLLTFDKIAIEDSVNDSFDFNAILIYYSVYNKTLDKVLAVNLLGVLFLDSPNGGASGFPPVEIVIPSITKIQSGVTGFGTSYSFRINIKSDSMMDDTGAVIYDESTSAQTALEDFSEVFDNLEKSVNILNQHTGTINYIAGQYNSIQNNQTQVLNQITDLQQSVNNISRDIVGTENTIAMFTGGDDPIGDSSIYMNHGNIGIFTQNPAWGFEVDSSVKVLDLIIENAIRDISGNILLGYGSPLQIGSSTNNRPMVFYTGNMGPSFTIDVCNNVRFPQTVYFDGSVVGISNNAGTFINSGLYVQQASLGTGLVWGINGLLYVDVSVAGGTVTSIYVDGSLATRDTAISLKADKASLNSSLGLYPTKINVNSSTNNIWVQFGNVSSSLNSISTGSFNAAPLNASIARIDVSLNNMYIRSQAIAAFASKSQFSTGTDGLVPHSVNSTGKFLRDDTTWSMATDASINAVIGSVNTLIGSAVSLNSSPTFTGTVTAVNFILSSDKNIKTNMQSISKSAPDIEYKQFELKSDLGQLRYGVIAQDLEKTHPELIRINSAGVLNVAYIDLLVLEIYHLKERVKELENKLNKA
jgi:hypothetical protein